MSCALTKQKFTAGLRLIVPEREGVRAPGSHYFVGRPAGAAPPEMDQIAGIAIEARRQPLRFLLATGSTKVGCVFRIRTDKASLWRILTVTYSRMWRNRCNATTTKETSESFWAAHTEGLARPHRM